MDLRSGLRFNDYLAENAEFAEHLSRPSKGRSFLYKTSAISAYSILLERLILKGGWGGFAIRVTFNDYLAENAEFAEHLSKPSKESLSYIKLLRFQRILRETNLLSLS